MLTIQLDPQAERRLEDFAKRAGQTAPEMGRRAIMEALSEWEDVAIAVERLENPGERMSMKEVETLLDLGR